MPQYSEIVVEKLAKAGWIANCANLPKIFVEKYGAHMLSWEEETEELRQNWRNIIKGILDEFYRL